MIRSHPQNALGSSHSCALESLCPGAFLLNPDNAGRLIGRSQLPLLLKKDWLLLLLLIALCGLSVFIGTAGITPLRIASEVQRIGLDVQGSSTANPTPKLPREHNLSRPRSVGRKMASPTGFEPVLPP